MLAQRGADLAGRPAARSTPSDDEKPARAARPRSSTRRLSFNDKHALDTLPAKIAALEQTVRGLQQRLDDPELYRRDRLAFEETSRAVAAAQAELAAAEDRWLELEALREEIEGR
jgi:ATP-binding cassette subfamily F protein uup